MSSQPISHDSGSSSGWTRSRIVFLGISAAFVVAVLWWSSEVLLPFVLALIVAYVLTPLVALCERKMPRAASIGVVYAVTLASLYGAVASVAPRLFQETAQLARESPLIAQRLAEKWGPWIDESVEGVLGKKDDGPDEDKPPPPALQFKNEADGSVSLNVGAGLDIIQESPKHWRVVQRSQQPQSFQFSRLLNDSIDQTVNYIKANALQLIRFGQVVVSRVTRGIFLTFMTLMLAAYMMHTREQITEFFRSLVPGPSRPGFDRLLLRMDRGLAGVVRGQLVICAVNGVLSAIGFALFGLKYWPVLALIAAGLSIIPIFGAILSSVPAVMIGLTQGFFTGLWVLLWILMIHQIEANFLNPKIIGAAAKLHPVLVVFVLIVGEHYYGLSGALLAVPVLSVVQSLFHHFRYESLPDGPPDSMIMWPKPAPPKEAGRKRR
jgi:predicted PurR-regulated permease PerM